MDPDGTLAGGIRSDHEEAGDSVRVTTHGRTNGGAREQKPPLGMPPAGASALQIPLAPGEFATITAAFPLTEDKWDQLLNVLEVFKKGLIARPEGYSAGDNADP
jgi:hypothetical protein